MAETISLPPGDIFPVAREPLRYLQPKNSDECGIARLAQIIHMFEGSSQTTDLSALVETVKRDIDYQAGSLMHDGIDTLYLLNRGYEVHQFLPPGCFETAPFIKYGRTYVEHYYKHVTSQEFWKLLDDTTIRTMQAVDQQIEAMPGYTSEQTTLTDKDAVYEMLSRGYLASVLYAGPDAIDHAVLITGYTPNQDRPTKADSWFSYADSDPEFQPLGDEARLTIGAMHGFVLDKRMKPKVGVTGVKK